MYWPNKDQGKRMKHSQVWGFVDRGCSVAYTPIINGCLQLINVDFVRAVVVTKAEPAQKSTSLVPTRL